MSKNAIQEISLEDYEAAVGGGVSDTIQEISLEDYEAITSSNPQALAISGTGASPSGRLPSVTIIPNEDSPAVNNPIPRAQNNVQTTMEMGADQWAQAETSPGFTDEEAAIFAQMRGDPSVPLADIAAFVAPRARERGLIFNEDDLAGIQRYRDELAAGGFAPSNEVSYSEGASQMARELLGPQQVANEDIENAGPIGSSLNEGFAGSLNSLIAEPLFDALDADVQGIGKDEIRAAYPHLSDDEVEAVHENLIGQRVRRGRDEATSLANLADPNPVTRFLGNTAGGFSLVDAIPGVGAETFAGRAALGAGLNAVTDVASQGADISYGARDEYDPSQTALSTAAGAVAQGGLEGLSRLIPRRAPAVAPDTPVLDALAREGISPDDLPPGVTPEDALAAIQQLRPLAREASEFGGSREPKPTDLFPTEESRTADAEDWGRQLLGEEADLPATPPTRAGSGGSSEGVGSFGKGNKAQPEVFSAVEASGVSLPSRTVPRAETDRLGQETGLTRETYGEDGSIGAISPVVARGLSLTREVASDVLDEFADTGKISDNLRTQLDDVAGTTSENLGETGRALNMASGGREGLTPSIAREFVALVDEASTSPRRTAALQKLANRYKGDPAAIVKIVADSRGRDILDYATSIRYNGMLSSLKTQVYNIAGYANTVIKKAAEPVGIALDKALSPVLDRLFPKSAGQPKLTYRGSVASWLPDPRGTLREATAAAVSGFRTGQPKNHADIQNMSRGSQRAMSWELPRKGMAAVDEFFDTILQRQERTARAIAYATQEGLSGDAHTARVQELVNQARTATKQNTLERARDAADRAGLGPKRGMTPEQRVAASKARQEAIASFVDEDAPYQIQRGAEEQSALMRFQEANSVGRFLNAITGRTENFHTVPLHQKPIELFKWFVQQVFPFANTTQNLIREGLRSYTPLAAVSPSNLKGVAQGGVARQRALANMALGGAATLLVTPLLEAGSLTGEGPRDPAEKQKLMLTGWRPNSYRTSDGEYISYRGLDPLSGALSMMATIYERSGGGSSDEEIGQAVGSFLEVFAKNSWAQSMTTLSDLAENSERSNNRTTRVGADLTASFVTPAVVRDVSEVVTGDRRQVDLRGDGSFTQRVLDQVKKTWFQSEDLPQAVDALGNPITRDEVVGPDFLSRIGRSPTTSDPVVLELARLNQLPSPIDKGDLRRVDATRQQVLDYQRLSGNYIYDYLSELVTTPEWSDMSDEEQARKINKVERDMRAYAREDLFPEVYGD